NWTVFIGVFFLFPIMLWIHLVFFALLAVVSGRENRIGDRMQNVTNLSNDILNWEPRKISKPNIPYTLQATTLTIDQ
ncbi:unnamed protein product, partial [Allacma fusca]